MNLEIKPLIPARVEDFFDFFDYRAFTDNSPMQPCFCCRPQMTQEQEKTELFKFIEANPGVMPRDIPDFRLKLREIAEKQILAGDLQGYLAYENGVSIGWCNANNKESYSTLGIGEAIRNASKTSPDESIISVLCFEIAPNYRGKGIASALLTYVCEDAKAKGFDAVEGYPQLRNQRETFDFFGPVRLFERCGFMKVAEQGDVAIMRKKF
ncbi:GNAT family N-acetyltransferase [Paenibacillus rubinfantis]|uniref:GNAT family N-acetyltransferase n=1 Tax=Paenibacillus rubinfantis TaxID=1720296 RepID=UPI00073F301E|nr:GNAT family N-acetyltransferase [Paenibacillus rubinfantis]